MSLRDLFDGPARREARIWAEWDAAVGQIAAEQGAQVAAHGPSDEEWMAMFETEERRMRLASDAARAWREIDTRPRPTPRHGRKATA